MIVINGKIVRATNEELFKYWLDHYSDLYSYDDYKRRVTELGVVVDESTN